ncbi:MAG: carbon monoxide dehydrogenase, partial [Lachnospiraceae bacterium]|nr:carbon monoxide dehydrogenase [Lachnospiraceae bacterium]
MEANFFTTVERMEEVSGKLLETAKMVGIDTWEDRKKNQTPSCLFGETGVCCKVCSMGPCRITPKAPKGICGATADTIAGRNYLRMVAAGAATHSDHGREICRVLYNADPNGSYKITDVAKLEKIAKEWGIQTVDRDIYDVAREVAYTGLMEYGKPFGKLNFLERANDERKKVWEE